MNLPGDLLPQAWYWTGHGLFVLVLLHVLRAAPWPRLKDSLRLNLWLGTAVSLMLLWSIKTGIKPGLSFHLLGATLFTLMFGPELAVAGMTLVLAGATLYGMGGVFGFSLNALLMGVVPVAVSHAVYRIVDKFLPRHFFVYIFVTAFFGAALVMAVCGLAVTGVMAASGVYGFSYLMREYLPYYILLAWGEALLTGMAVTIMVVYQPGWVCTFDDARYLRNK